ncbi:MAG: ABC transporter ATP-binding protein [Solirubrobacteraceae bacterium]|nr:ABC transporter ATP-binding protein [Solirubrobacteraceae bacterium]
MTTPAIELRDLSVVFNGEAGRVQALSNINLTIDPGEFVVLIGPSGQGKSTLLNVIAGLLKPTEGEILAHGEAVSGPSRERAMVFQEDTVFPWMRVGANVDWALKLRGVAPDERKALTARYLEEVGLSHTAGAWPRELSGGMRKRVSLATAFAADPEVLLMDEPFGPLDFVTRSTLHSIVIRLWSEERKTIVFVTHDVDETLLLADRVLVIRHGEIVDDLRLDFARPRTDDLRADPDAIAMRRRLLDQLGVVDPARAALAR